MTSEMDSEAVSAVRDRVRDWLSEDYGSCDEVGSSGMFSVRYGSSRVFVNVYPRGPEGSIVALIVWLLLEVPKSDVLNEWVAHNSAEPVFGTYFLDPGEDPNLVDLCLCRHVPGESLTAEELRLYLGYLWAEVERSGPRLQSRFGGHSYGDQRK